MITVIGRHSKEYIIQVTRWAKRLLATEGTIWSDGTVTLTCSDGYICNYYRPTPKELRR